MSTVRVALYCRRTAGVVFLLGALVFSPGRAVAQDLEPGAYWPLPVGINILTAINATNAGDVTYAPSIPIEAASATINTTTFAYTRWISIAGRSANFSAQFPIVAGHLEGRYLGQPASVNRFGQGDPRFRLAMNLYGAPSMTPAEAASYRLRTLVGVSVTVAAPLGQYDTQRVINIGTNRWSVKPEIGLVHAAGPWVIEMMASAWLYADNEAIGVHPALTQAPLGSAQLHLIYRFRQTGWLAADANFYTGGQTTTNGEKVANLQRTSRIGATYTRVLTRRHSIRASVSRAVYSTIGGDFTSVAVGYNYAWVK